MRYPKGIGQRTYDAVYGIGEIQLIARVVYQSDKGEPFRSQTVADEAIVGRLVADSVIFLDLDSDGYLPTTIARALCEEYVTFTLGFFLPSHLRTD